MGLELGNCEIQLEAEIRDLDLIRQDIAMTYGLAMKSSERDRIDWAKINGMIAGRWSLSALRTIKRWAWAGKFPRATRKEHYPIADLGLTLCGRDFVRGDARIVYTTDAGTCKICNWAIEKREDNHAG